MIGGEISATTKKAISSRKKTHHSQGFLMAIKKLDDGRYEVDIRPTGRNGKRIRRKFDKKSEAVAFEEIHVVQPPQ